jgi:hypothetical protein
MPFKWAVAFECVLSRGVCVLARKSPGKKPTAYKAPGEEICCQRILNHGFTYRSSKNRPTGSPVDNKNSRLSHLNILNILSR